MLVPPPALTKKSMPFLVSHPAINARMRSSSRTEYMNGRLRASQDGVHERAGVCECLATRSPCCLLQPPPRAPVYSRVSSPPSYRRTVSLLSAFSIDCGMDPACRSEELIVGSEELLVNSLVAPDSLVVPDSVEEVPDSAEEVIAGSKEVLVDSLVAPDSIEEVPDSAEEVIAGSEEYSKNACNKCGHAIRFCKQYLYFETIKWMIIYLLNCWNQIIHCLSIFLVLNSLNGSKETQI